MTERADFSIGRRVQLWRSVMEVHAAVLQALGEELGARHGLSVNEFDALVNIPGDGIRHRELTECVILSQSALSRLLDRLAGRGLIERADALDDGRGIEIRLTSLGRRVRAQAIRTNATVVDREFASQLTGRELPVLDAAFGRLARSGNGQE